MTSTAAGPDAADAPLLENEHMLYTVTLSDEGGSYEGNVTFRPPFSSTYVFNLSDDVPVEVVAADDQSAPCHAASQALEGCSGLALAELYTLEQKRTYLVKIGPAATETLQLVVEEHIVSSK